MSTSKIIVNAESNTVTVLEGKAPEPINLKSCDISGNINAVADYLAVPREPAVDTKTAFIVMDTVAGTITLETQEHHPIKTTVSGALKVNPLFEDLGINTGIERTPDELASLLRMNRAWFANRDQLASQVGALRDVKVKISTEIQKSDDKAGNVTDSLAQTVAENSLPKKLQMLAPVYEGDFPQEIEVEVLVKANSGGVKLYLESPALEEAKVTQQQVHFAKHKADFEALNFMVITR